MTNFLPKKYKIYNIFSIQAEKYILAEESRVQAYLHISSRDALMAVVHDELLSLVQTELLSKDTGTDSLLARNSVSGMHIMCLWGCIM